MKPIFNEGSNLNALSSDLYRLCYLKDDGRCLVKKIRATFLHYFCLHIVSYQCKKINYLIKGINLAYTIIYQELQLQ